MKVKTDELVRRTLDWAVSQCEGVNAETFRLFYEPQEASDYDKHGYPEFHYSSIWAQGGPIIEREDIRHEKFMGTFYTWMGTDPEGDRNPRASGPTLLIAAMRCYVAFKLGDTVDIPEELCK